MYNNIKIAVIGSTGKAGKYLLQQLLLHGYHCRVLLRNPENFAIESPLVEIIKGDARDYHSISQLLKGCTAVVSTLGQPKDGPPIFSGATKNVIKAMDEHGIQRYVVATGLSVNTPFDNKSLKTAFATDWMYKNYPATTANKQEEYEVLCKSVIDWVMVRLPLIEQTANSPQVLTNLYDCPGDGVSATSLAHFMIEQIFSEEFIKQAPFIANAE